MTRPRPQGEPIIIGRGPLPAEQPRWRWARRHGTAPLMVLGDLLGLVVGLALTQGAPNVLALGVDWTRVQWLGLGLAVLVGVIVGVGLMGLQGRFLSRLTWSVWDVLPSLAMASVAAVAAAEATRYYLVHPVTSPTRLAVAITLVFTGLVLARLASIWLVHHVRVRGLVNYRTLIVGAGPEGERMARVLKENRRYGLRPIGFLDAPGVVSTTLPMLDRPANLVRAVRRHRADVVIVAFPDATTNTELVEHLRACEGLGIDLFWVPRMPDVHPRAASTDEVWGVPLIRASEARFRPVAWRLKRVVDIVVAASALVVLSPLLAVVGLLARRETGQVLFRQPRVSLGGEEFSLLKFCSMRPEEGEAATRWNISTDDRVGPVGRFIRATSIDELPQLLNVLRGDMSLVGPRPERPHFVREFSQTHHGYYHRHRVPAGLTGWSAVNGLRGDTSIEDRAVFDNYYVDNWSLWFDLKIVLMTFVAVLRRTGS